MAPALCDKKFETSLTPEFTGEGKTGKTEKIEVRQS